MEEIGGNQHSRKDTKSNKLTLAKTQKDIANESLTIQKNYTHGLTILLYKKMD